MASQIMTIEQAFGKAVRIRRKAMGWNQRDLANHAGLQTAAVSRVERGDGAPTLRTMERIAAALSVRLSLLIWLAERLRAAKDTPASPTSE
ncbi:helix-turn-helix transcriptional regulator [Cupriavidus sp. 2SB]|uniref:helix-turn-helix domain-containing protein n=1 Tax=Cupriavidus sp. 2SB TaxID=2502199 RepID=UPI0010FA2E84|nr:helix-turn-helix transcriptional regulator [Cupriavidus sp. 2SB]